jgi:hypothetical protein
MWGKMIKNIALTLLTFFVTYAIISDIGKPQHTYRMPYAAAITD